MFSGHRAFPHVTPQVRSSCGRLGRRAPCYRAVATFGADRTFTFTETNAYSGSNGRAAILNDRRRASDDLLPCVGLGCGTARLGDRLVPTARHVITPALAGAGGRVLIRPVGVAGWLPGRVEWHDTGTDTALIAIEDPAWQPPAGQSVLRWGTLAGSDPVPCAAVGFPWASVRPDLLRSEHGLVPELGWITPGCGRSRLRWC